MVTLDPKKDRFRKSRPRIRAYNSAWKRNNPKKARVESWTRKAVRRGLIVKKPCEVCQSERFVVAHHDDYDRRAEIRWLCRVHHHEWHQLNGEGANAHTAEKFCREHRSASGVVGVVRRRSGWRAVIYVNRKPAWTCQFRTKEEAALAREAEMARRAESKKPEAA